MMPPCKDAAGWWDDACSYLIIAFFCSWLMTCHRPTTDGRMEWKDDGKKGNNWTPRWDALSASGRPIQNNIWVDARARHDVMTSTLTCGRTSWCDVSDTLSMIIRVEHLATIFTTNLGLSGGGDNYTLYSNYALIVIFQCCSYDQLASNHRHACSTEPEQDKVMLWKLCKWANERTIERTNEQTNERTNERTNHVH